MQVEVSPRRNAAAAVAVAALLWLVMAVNSLGDDAQRGAAFLLRQPPSAPLVIPGETPVAFLTRTQTAPPARD
jgi:hypothetical protein